MRKLNKKAKKIMDKIMDGLNNVGDYNKINNNDIFMPLCIDVYGESDGYKFVSMCHYGEMNGDLMRDPEVTFLMRGNEYFPATMRNDFSSYFSEEVFILDCQIMLREKGQRDLTLFCQDWLDNIKYQQFVK